jgi:hypothetical protein
VLLTLLPQAAFAALSVDFAATPLFAEANIVPGDSVSRMVTVTNTGVESEEVYVSVENTFSDGLADAMLLTVSDGPTTYVSGTFTSFFAGTPHPLGALGAGLSRTYTFTATLPEGIGNDAARDTLGFDLVLGFAGGEAVSDRPGSRSGAGGGGTDDELSLFNQAAAFGVGGSFVTWNSNEPATSYLVCGDMADGPFTLRTEPPLFGYQFALPETSERTVTHQFIFEDLAPGTYECRPAGRTSPSEPFTVGAAVQLTVPEGQVAGIATQARPLPLGSVFQVANAEVTPEEAPAEVAGAATFEEPLLPLPTVPAALAACQIIWPLVLGLVTFLWWSVSGLLAAVRGPAIFRLVYTSLMGIYTALAWWLLPFTPILALVFGAAWLSLALLYELSAEGRGGWLRASYYALCGLILIVLSLVWPVLCHTWPYLGLLVLAVVTLIVPRFLRR